jgi:hypothetical protein
LRNHAGGPFLPAKLAPFLAATDILVVISFNLEPLRRAYVGDEIVANDLPKFLQ